MGTVKERKIISIQDKQVFDKLELEADNATKTPVTGKNADDLQKTYFIYFDDQGNLHYLGKKGLYDILPYSLLKAHQCNNQLSKTTILNLINTNQSHNNIYLALSLTFIALGFAVLLFVATGGISLIPTALVSFMSGLLAIIPSILLFNHLEKRDKTQGQQPLSYIIVGAAALMLGLCVGITIGFLFPIVTIPLGAIVFTIFAVAISIAITYYSNLKNPSSLENLIDHESVLHEETEAHVGALTNSPTYSYQHNTKKDSFFVSFPTREKQVEHNISGTVIDSETDFPTRVKI